MVVFETCTFLHTNLPLWKWLNTLLTGNRWGCFDHLYINLYCLLYRMETHTVCQVYHWTPWYPVQCPAHPVCMVQCTLPTTPPHWMAVIYHAHLLLQGSDSQSMSAVSLDSLVSSTMPSTSSMYGTVRSQNVDSVFFAKPSASISQRGSTKSWES